MVALERLPSIRHVAEYSFPPQFDSDPVTWLAELARELINHLPFEQRQGRRGWPVFKYVAVARHVKLARELDVPGSRIRLTKKRKARHLLCYANIRFILELHD